jgi:hypothetical protein
MPTKKKISPSSKENSWTEFFRKVDQELLKESKVLWTMTEGKEHRVQWVCKNGNWGLTPMVPKKGATRVSYLSCIHRIPERNRFWKKLHQQMGDGGRVLVMTQGCQATYPIPPRLASCAPDTPSVETLLKEMNFNGFTAFCAKVHLVKRKVKKNIWQKWLLDGCFSDMDYCDSAELEGFCQTLPSNIEVVMAYYILVGIKLGPQSGLIDIRPSRVHGLSACARTPLEKNWTLLAIPNKKTTKKKGAKSNEWHLKHSGIGLHLCSTIYRLFNHNERPNCTLTSDGLIRTSRSIKAGEELSLDYSATPEDNGKSPPNH